MYERSAADCHVRSSSAGAVVAAGGDWFVRALSRSFGTALVLMRRILEVKDLVPPSREAVEEAMRPARLLI